MKQKGGDTVWQMIRDVDGTETQKVMQKQVRKVPVLPGQVFDCSEIYLNY